MTDNLDELRHIQGFPKGKDEDLLMLSNPPEYTSYPNPHIAEFITKYGKPYDEEFDDYHREPFISDISEGKSEPIYNAHSYHTKVPHKAIIPFIDHYTEPGDFIFDGFCGTGMTGVAAQSLGRHAILSDLSPAATFITYNYNIPVNILRFHNEAERILKEVEVECGWMYETIHIDGKKGRVNFTVWSDIFICPYCNDEIIFWDAAVDSETGNVKKDFFCPACKAEVGKTGLKRATELVFDQALGKSIETIKQKPVLINYSINKKRYEKRPDSFDISLIKNINEKRIPYWYPSYPLMHKGGVEWGDQWRAGYHIGVTNTHHFYAKRNLWTISAIYDRINRINKNAERSYLFLWFTSQLINLSRMNRFRRVSFPYNPLSGTLYISSITSEADPFTAYRNKLKKLLEAKSGNYRFSEDLFRISTNSAVDIRLVPSDSIDYIFTDPPFGDNLAYSELNFIWESWLRAFTNTKTEAIMSKAQAKKLDDYRELMSRSFEEMYRILKPGRWITVVFHNSKASVWNAIQDSLARAGFFVAQVSAMDKQQGSFNQVTAISSAVKNDLIINAYKPRTGFTQRFILEVGYGLESEFVYEFLRQLPLTTSIERSKEMLYSKYLAYYIQHGYQVIYNGEQFYKAMVQWGLEERDGYWFLDETQANDYEKRKAKTFGKGGKQQQAVLFISDERSARQWIWDFLIEPKSFDDIYTNFVKALQTSEDEIPEVKEILEESFVRTNGHWKRPDQFTRAELEKKRQERLLRQFEEYLNTARSNQKLKEVRLEAVIAGFTECYRTGRFKDILTVGRKLDKGLLENSSDLYDFIDIAEAKVEG